MSDRRRSRHRPPRTRAMPAARLALLSVLPLSAAAIVALGLTVPEVNPDPAAQDSAGGLPGEALSREEFFGEAVAGGDPDDAQPAAERAEQEREPAEPPHAVAEVAASDEPDDDEDEESSQEDTGSSGGATVEQVVQLTNAERAAVGCDPLRVDSRLTEAAQGHSEDMASREYMAHESPEGVNPSDRAEAAGYSALSGENVAAGQRSAEEVMDAWMNSEGHRANIVNCDNVAIGVGEDDFYWTQKFGAE